MARLVPLKKFQERFEAIARIVNASEKPALFLAEYDGARIVKSKNGAWGVEVGADADLASLAAGAPSKLAASVAGGRGHAGELDGRFRMLFVVGDARLVNSVEAPGEAVGYPEKNP